MSALEGSDLFGEPNLRRSAYFPYPGVRRRLTRTWSREGKRAFVLGCNPSNAGADSEDNTTRWWNRWFEHWGFAGYDAGNLYSFVTPSPAECKARAERALDGHDFGDRDEMFANREAVKQMAKIADQVFVCFGNIAWDQDWAESVLEEIQQGEEPWPDLWCWGTTKSGAPIHPMARGRHRIDPLQPAILWRSA